MMFQNSICGETLRTVQWIEKQRVTGIELNSSIGKFALVRNCS